jgi:succinoglycan biosynthesis protein ExoM
MTSPAPTVAVVVFTDGSPGDLAQVLPLLVQQARSVAPPADVLVIDVDPSGRAERIVRACSSEVRYVHEPSGGKAAARNLALEECARDLVVFLDDDERPTARWLRSLLDVYRRDRPAGVIGPVVFEPAREPDPWIVDGGFLEREPDCTWAGLEAPQATNLMLDVAQARARGLRFHEDAALSDVYHLLFTRRLTARGGHLAWCEEASVTEVVPPSRLTREWVLRRACAMGVGRGRVAVELAESAPAVLRARVMATAQGIGLVLRAGLAWLWVAMTGIGGGQARRTYELVHGAGVVRGAWARRCPRDEIARSRRDVADVTSPRPSETM